MHCGHVDPKRFSTTRTQALRLDGQHAANSCLSWRCISLPCGAERRCNVLLDYVDAEGAVRPSPIEAIEAEASGIDTSLILCGHTHIPRVVRLRDGRMIVNPGSVGLPGYDGQTPVPYKVEVGTPDACYAILERTRAGWSTAIRYVPYDSAAAAEMAKRRGWPVWASALATGWIDSAA